MSKTTAPSLSGQRLRANTTGITMIAVALLFAVTTLITLPSGAIASAIIGDIDDDAIIVRAEIQSADQNMILMVPQGKGVYVSRGANEQFEIKPAPTVDDVRVMATQTAKEVIATAPIVASLQQSAGETGAQLAKAMETIALQNTAIEQLVAANTQLTAKLNTITQSVNTVAKSVEDLSAAVLPPPPPPPPPAAVGESSSQTSSGTGLIRFTWGGWRDIAANVYKWTLPKAGRYIIFATLRAYQTTGSGFSKIRIPGVGSSDRMVSEFYGDVRFRLMNHVASFAWYTKVDGPTTLRLQAARAYCGSCTGIQSDRNGYNELTALSLPTGLNLWQKTITGSGLWRVPRAWQRRSGYSWNVKKGSYVFFASLRTWKSGRGSFLKLRLSEGGTTMNRGETTRMTTEFQPLGMSWHNHGTLTMWTVNFDKDATIHLEAYCTVSQDAGIQNDGNGWAELIALPISQEQLASGAAKGGLVKAGLHYFEHNRFANAPSAYKWVIPRAGTYIFYASLRTFQRGSGCYGKVRVTDPSGREVHNSVRMMTEYQGKIWWSFTNMQAGFVWRINAKMAGTYNLQGYATCAQRIGLQNDSNGYSDMGYILSA